MSQHFMTVCVVCVLCASHIPCSAHTTISSVLKASLVTEKKDFVSNTLSTEQLNPLDKINDNYNDKVNINYENKKKNRKKKTHNDKLKQYNDNDYQVHHDNNYNLLENEEIMERLGQIPSQINENLFVSKNNINSYRKGNQRNKRHVETEEKYFLKKIFDTYGDGNSLTMDGFEVMLKQLGLFKLIVKLGLNDNINSVNNETSADSPKSQSNSSIPKNSNNNSENYMNSKDECANKNQVLASISSNIDLSTSTKNDTILPGWLFERLCPVLLYHLASKSKSEKEGCISLPNNYHEMHSHEYFEEESRDMVQVWVYSTISIVVISLCGLLGVAVIPVMGKSYYHQLIQFLVALAIGTLCGDALIHLLPHAMMVPHSHDEGNTVHVEINSEDSHNSNMWKGLVAMIGLIMFFFMEKALSMISEWRKYRQRKNKLPTRVRVMREPEGIKTSPVGEKLCKHKYSSYPYCYGEITTETRDNQHEHHEHYDKERLPSIEEAKPLTSDPTNQLPKIITDDLDKNNHDNWGIDDHKVNNTHKSNDKDNLDNPQVDERDSYTVIIREHENKHHGHTHSHGHVHAAPDSMSSVAWMVIMGDGLHNFTDGMAIGAAFSANIAGGFSTAIAVFCHELPHELGDFAVLLKAGMSAKQAVFYNLLSSVLCLFGMIFGVLLGAMPSTTSWIFAAAAGMFIYIALVDMIPELSSGHSEESGSHWQCLLQALGLITGLGIMLIIALYENDLKNIFSN
ncbi:hypothetical protein G9C98_008240 [Cotesia typhae]|uniref:Zinc transporter foi n=1 Tax=Cotesia typhae TaxID=2053667 RepID=A0A8J5QZN9_9HYME|nr:hypothetical protein G9C98_008240 [Cotesia typhae]